MAQEVDPLRKEIVLQLNGGNAHAPLEKVVENFPDKLRGVVPEGLPYSAWQLLEHLRIAQADIVEFCIGKNYREKKWPEDYWPKEPAPKRASDWDESVNHIHQDRKEFTRLISEAKADLFAPLPSGTGQTLFHEACLIIDHNAYHLGEIVTLRRLLGAWPPGK